MNIFWVNTLVEKQYCEASDLTLLVTISGHASNIGSAKYNLSLSTRRAQAVEALLVLKFNIDPSRITSKGYGFTQPLIKGHSPAANEVNRRIEAEITITSPTP